MTTEADTCRTLITAELKSVGCADGELQFLAAAHKHLPDVLKVPPNLRKQLQPLAFRLQHFPMMLRNAVNQLQTLLYAA